MSARLRERLVAGFVAGLAVIVAPSLATPSPMQCIPGPDCSGAAQCCNFKHDSLLRFQMADARKMRDYFGDACNVAKFTRQGNFSGADLLMKAADQAEADSTQSSALGAQMTAEDAAMHNSADLGAKTDPLSCQSTFKPGYDNQTTCQELIDAAHQHEGEHQDYCEMMKTFPSGPQQFGPAYGPKSIAESERRAHAIEYLSLVSKYEAARRRCLSAKQKLTPELEQQSKNRVNAARNSFLHGGGTCPQ